MEYDHTTGTAVISATNAELGHAGINADLTFTYSYGVTGVDMFNCSTAGCLVKIFGYGFNSNSRFRAGPTLECVILWFSYSMVVCELDLSDYNQNRRFLQVVSYFTVIRGDEVKPCDPAINPVCPTITFSDAYTPKVTSVVADPNPIVNSG
ncbi:MAG: hypothetical protein V2I33_20425 [Kangiellaceae bacterium]|jgi:hypothetical protein|nr:hypothetical protein [Kangiellaceae bacterium]